MIEEDTQCWPCPCLCSCTPTYMCWHQWNYINTMYSKKMHTHIQKHMCKPDYPHIYTQNLTHMHTCIYKHEDAFLYFQYWRKILRPEDHEFKASLSYTMRFLKGEKNRRTHTQTHSDILRQNFQLKLIIKYCSIGVHHLTHLEEKMWPCFYDRK